MEAKRWLISFYSVFQKMIRNNKDIWFFIWDLCISNKNSQIVASKNELHIWPSHGADTSKNFDLYGNDAESLTLPLPFIQANITIRRPK